MTVVLKKRKCSSQEKRLNQSLKSSENLNLIMVVYDFKK